MVRRGETIEAALARAALPPGHRAIVLPERVPVEREAEWEEAAVRQQRELVKDDGTPFGKALA